ncbi:hypothetical protein VPH35_109126 [Triticum aestivum]
MNAAASASDDGSRHPRLDRAPSTLVGAAKFMVCRPCAPLFHLPSSIAGAAWPWACSALRPLVQCRSGIRQDCNSSLDRYGGSHGLPLPTASPFPTAYCKHGE